MPEMSRVRGLTPNGPSPRDFVTISQTLDGEEREKKVHPRTVNHWVERCGWTVKHDPNGEQGTSTADAEATADPTAAAGKTTRAKGAQGEKSGDN